MKYGYFCEDEALEFFIDEVLIKLGPNTKCKEFSKHQDCCSAFRLGNGRNTTGIKKAYVEIAKKAFDKFDIDLYVAAYDFEDNDIKSYPQHIEDQTKKIDNKVRRRSVLCIPIKSIEYWLWYAKHCEDKNVPEKEQLERDASFNRDLAKVDVYEGELNSKGRYKDQSSTKELAKAAAILDDLNTDRLRQLSPSFDKFVQQIETFCNTYGGK